MLLTPVHLLAICLSITGDIPAVGWRQDGTGVYADADPPVTWDTTKNIVWSVELPDRGNALPIVVGDRVLVTAEPYELLCLSKSDGKLLWRRSNAYRDVTAPEAWTAVEAELRQAAPLRGRWDETRHQIEQLRKKAADADLMPAETARLEALESAAATLATQLAKFTLATRYTVPATEERYNGYTTATPTSDGRRVWCVFGNRVVVCRDLDGQLAWSIVLPDNPHAMWGHTSSPLLVDDKLIVNMERTVGLDAATGRQVWETRQGQSWGSAVRARIGSESLVLLPNGRMLRAADGKVLQRVSGLANSSPVVRDGIAYYIDIRSEAHELPKSLAPGAENMEVTTRWSTELKGGTFFASAVVADGLIYAVSTRQVLNVIDAQTGQAVYARRLDLGSEPAWSSLCLAGRYLYASGRDGTTVVFERGREYREVNRNRLETLISTPVFDENRMYVRTAKRLYCVGSAAKSSPCGEN